jgi:pyruvyl transferase EpsO
LKASIQRFVSRGQTYALVDFPNHSNVGDSAIWLGAIELLREITGREPSYVSALDDFDAPELRAALGSGTLFIHGGGNFGDIWPEHQQFRIRLMEMFGGETIVQLPQTIRFDDPAAVAETARAMERHGKFHLFVRDAESEAFARENMPCPVTLTPDCALGLGAIASSRPEERDILFLLRTDKEAAAVDYAPFAGFKRALRCDWLDEPTGDVRRTFRRARGQALMRGRLTRASRRVPVFDALARHRVERGLNLIDSSARVVTDRLHVHILSTLLGVPHVALDNYYGKIGSYIKQWSSGVDIVATASTAEEAIEKLASSPPRDRTTRA